MNIVRKDTRELTDVNPINYQAEDIVFNEMKITWNYAWDIEDMLKWNWNLINFNFTKIQLSWNIEIFDMWWNFFVVEYTDKQVRDKDINLLKQNFIESGKFAKELEEKRQIPEFEGYFDYNWKSYAIVNGLNKLTDEINPKLGIYKWVVVNPARYFETVREVDWVRRQISDIVK